jgi:hypothetical protein
MLTAQYMAEQIKYPLPLSEYGKAIWQMSKKQGCFAQAYVLDSKLTVEMWHTFEGSGTVANSISIPIGDRSDQKDKIEMFCIDGGSDVKEDVDVYAERFISFIKTLGNPVFFDSYSNFEEDEDLDLQ